MAGMSLSILGCGAAGGLLLLAWCDSVILATLLAGVLAWLVRREEGGVTEDHSEEEASLKNVTQSTITNSQEARLVLLSEVLSGTTLSPITVKEPLSGIALLKQELTHKKILDGVSKFEKEALNSVEIDEKIVLPNKETINLEKSIFEHLKGIGEFDQANLTPVKTSEPLSGRDLAKQETWRSRITQELTSFDKSDLKLTPTRELKNLLPSQSTITSEKLHLNLMTGLVSGVELKKTETKEPVSAMDLARLEMLKDQVEEDIQAFDRGRLTPVVTEVRYFLPTAEDLSDDRK